MHPFFVTAAGKCVCLVCFARINKILLNIKIFNISFSITLHQANCLLNALKMHLQKSAELPS